MLCVCCCHSHCCCGTAQDKSLPLPVTYNLGNESKQDIRSFLQTETESLEDVRSILTKYNPELCKYFCSRTETRATTVIRTEPAIQPNRLAENISGPPGKSSAADNIKEGQPSQAQPAVAQQIEAPQAPNEANGNSNDLQYRQPKEKSEADRIAEQLAKQEGSTRQFPDTKFRRYYSKQCIQNYGRTNINPTKGGIFHGDYMKTHNVNPHTLGNRPQYYETYNGALEHAKHQKRDRNQRQKELERELKRKASTSGGDQNEQYNGVCGQTQDEHIYDQHDDRHRSKQSRTRVKQEDRKIEQIQQDNFKRAAAESTSRKKLPPSSKHVNGDVQPRVEAVVEKASAQIAPQVKPKTVTIIELRNIETQTEVQKEPPTKVRHVANTSVSTKQTKPIANRDSKNIQQGQRRKMPTKQPRNQMPPPVSQQPILVQEPLQAVVRESEACCTECQHRKCQCLREMKSEILERAQQDPELAHRLIAYARRQNLYRNYSFELDSLNRYPCLKNQFEKYYYEWPRYKLDPKNYKCTGHGCLQQIPYAGKGMLNGHYDYQPHQP